MATEFKDALVAQIIGPGQIETVRRKVKPSDVPKGSDPLSIQHERELADYGHAQSSARLHIPLTSRLNLRESAETLEHLALQLRQLADQSAIQEIKVIGRAATAIRAADKELRDSVPKSHWGGLWKTDRDRGR